jgi:formylglycine-generating enzyme required for sulfatase activity
LTPDGCNAETMNTLQLSWSAIVPTLLTAALLLSACGEEELGPPACDLELRDGSAAETWIRVEPGSFMMGRNEDFQQWYLVDKGDRAEVLPQMQATITRPYYAMATELTNGTWDEVMDGNRVLFTECATCLGTVVR